MAVLDNMMSDPFWAEMHPSDQKAAIDAKLASHPFWKEMHPQDQANAQDAAYSKANLKGSKIYDPARAEAIEDPTGAHPGRDPGIETTDAITKMILLGFNAPLAMGEAAAGEGASLLAPKVIGAGLKTLGGNVLASAASERAQGLAEPLINKIPGEGPLGKTARFAAEQVAGVAPLLAYPAAIRMGRGAGGFMTGNAERGIVGKEIAEKATEKIAGAEAQAADKIVASQEHVQQLRLGADQDAAKEMSGLHEKLAEQYHPEARSEIIAKELGRSRVHQPTIEIDGVRHLSPTDIDHNTANYNAVHDAYSKLDDSFHKQYEAIAKNPKPLNASPMTETLGILKGRLAERGETDTISPAAKKLMMRAEGIAGSAGPPDALASQYSAKEIQKMSPSERQGLQAMMSRGTTKSTAPPLNDAGEPAPLSTIKKRVVTSAKPAAPIQTTAPLAALMTDARELGRKANGTDAWVAGQIYQSAGKALEMSGVPRAAELNQRYLQEKITPFHLNKNVFDEIKSATNPIQYAPTIFEDPVRSKLILDNSTPEGKAILRNNFTNWALSDPDKILTGANVEGMKDTMKSLGFKGPLVDPKSWVYQNARMARFADIVGGSPALQERAHQDVVSYASKVQNDMAAKILPALRKKAVGFGTTGKRIIAQMNAAKSYPEAVEIGTKALSEMTPKEIIEFGPNSSPLSELHIPKQTPQMGMPIPPPTTPEEAGIAAIRGGMKARESHIMERIKAMVPFYATFSGASLLLHGSISPYIGGMALIGGAARSFGPLQRAFARAAENPEEAARLFQAYAKPAAPGNFEVITQNLARGAMGDAIAGIVKHGEPLYHHTALELGHAVSEAPPKESEKTSMVPRLDRSRAIQMAKSADGTVNIPRVDRIQELNKQVASKPPEIQADLNRGRLTRPDVDKVLKQSEDGTMSALLKGVNPGDAIDIAAKGSAADRALIVPMLQKQMTELLKNQKMPKQQMANLMARFNALKKMDAQSEGDVV